MSDMWKCQCGFECATEDEASLHLPESREGHHFLSAPPSWITIKMMPPKAPAEEERGKGEAGFEQPEGTWCPECGPNVKVDEEGLCVSCGAVAIGNGANAALRALSTRPAPAASPDALRERLAKAARTYMDLAHEHKQADYACSEGCQCIYCKARRELGNALVIPSAALLRAEEERGKAEAGEPVEGYSTPDVTVSEGAKGFVQGAFYWTDKKGTWAEQVKKIVAEANKRFPARPAPDGLLDDAMGLLHNHEQDHDPGWQKDFEDVCARYAALAAPSEGVGEAPWTQEEMWALNERQNDESLHPYTCGLCGYALLKARMDGWWCDECKRVTQTWAHSVDLHSPEPPKAGG
jgi:hypothetical protein